MSDLCRWLFVLFTLILAGTLAPGSDGPTPPSPKKPSEPNLHPKPPVPAGSGDAQQLHPPRRRVSDQVPEQGRLLG